MVKHVHNTLAMVIILHGEGFAVNLRTLKILIVCVMTVAALLTVLTGCGKPDGPKYEMLVAIDNSDSVSKEMRELYAGHTEFLVRKLRRKALVKVYRFSHESLKIYEGVPQSPKYIWKSMDEQVKNVDANKQEYTYVVPALKNFVEDTKKSDVPVVGIVFSDGQFFDSKQDLLLVAGELASSECFKMLMVCPVITKENENYRAQLEKDLKPLVDAGKLTISSEYDMNGFKPLLDATKIEEE